VDTTGSAQLNHALNTRVVIEQAKGVVSQRAGLNMEHSFARLRNHARNHHLRLADVAQDIADGTLATTALDPLRPPPGDSASS
jgi:AmiR/NasT family two-component response regulator